MQASDLMLATTEVVHVDQSLHEAELRLRRFGLPALPVVDGDEIVGLLTAETLEDVALTPERDLSEVAVRDHMTAEIAFCHPGESIETARSVMQEDGHDYLLVVDSKRRLCGLLSAESVGPGAKAHMDTSHVVKSAGRATGDKLHQPDSFSVKPIVKKQ